MGSCYRGGTFKSLWYRVSFDGVLPRSQRYIENWVEAKGLNEWSLGFRQKSYSQVVEEAFVQFINALKLFLQGGSGYAYSCGNRPATPLNDAHQGGCFIFREGGLGR